MSQDYWLLIHLSGVYRKYDDSGLCLCMTTKTVTLAAANNNDVDDDNIDVDVQRRRRLHQWLLKEQSGAD